ncbi:MAG: hypothetical protein ACJAYE_001527 [Candidatus Azotimanducaceae bacterium]|jgi:hypothetical protein
MKNHKLEIYLDSYDSVPFVTDMTDDGPLESSICHWLQTQTGKTVDIEKHLKIEDVGHPRVAKHFEATRLRVKLV